MIISHVTIIADSALCNAIFGGNFGGCNIFVYKQNNTWMSENMKFFLVLTRISHSFALLTREISWSSVDCSKHPCIIRLIIYMKKILHSDWLRAVQFLVNTVPKKEFSAKKGNSVQISLDCNS